MRAMLVLVLTVLTVASAAEATLGTPPLVQAPRCRKAPVVDGVLEDGCWVFRSMLGPFVDIRRRALAEEQTQAFVVWDDQRLYVAFRCLESRMDVVVATLTERDADNLWREDAVELFIQPPGADSYLHWVINPLGTVYDERCKSQGERDPGWNSAIEVRTTRGEDAWFVEAAVPWSDVGGPPAVGDTWRMNVNREQQSRNEWSGWAITASGFHEPEHFGLVRFSESDPGVRVALGDIFLGINQAQVTITGEAKNVSAHVTGTASLVSFARRPQRLSYDLSFRVARSGPGRVGVMITDGDNVVFRSAEFPYFIEPVDQRLEALRQRAMWLRDQAERKQWNQVPPAQRQLQADARLAAVTWARLKRRVDEVYAGRGGRTEWRDLAQGVEQLQATVERLCTVFRAWEAMGGDAPPVFALAPVPSTVKVLRDLPHNHAFSRVGWLRLARNEHEAVQVVITPFAYDLKNVQVKVGEFVGAGGELLPPEAIDVRRVGFVKTRPPAYKVDYVGWYPDPLMPLDTFDVPVGRNQPIWIAIRAPRDTPPGVYVGEVTVKPANAPEEVLYLKVEVWDLTLPRTTTLKTAISNWWTDFAGWYGQEELSTEQRRKYYSFWLERRINPGTIYSWRPYWSEEDLRWCINHGMNAFCIKYQGPLGGDTPEQRQAREAELAEWARDYAQMLRDNGWIDKGYVYGFDEVQPDGYDEVLRAYQIIKQAAPDLRTACTVVPNEKLNPVMDIWVPLTPALENPNIWRHVDPTDEMWWYVCCGPHHPYANWFIDYSALEHRLLFWQTYKYKVKGFLYYAVAMWQSNRSTRNEPSYIVPHDDPEWLAQIEAGKRWPEVEWNTFTFDRYNGDGHLYYPGPGMTMIPSQRLENIRDGIEDYELLHELELVTDQLERVVYQRDQDHALAPHETPWLRDATAQSNLTRLPSECRELLGPRRRLLSDLTHYTDDPQVLEEERGAIARQIMRVRRVLAR